MMRLFCFGLGYSALHLARRLRKDGWHIAGTARTAEGAAAFAREGVAPLVFDGTRPGAGVREALQEATHVLVSVPPDAAGDPVLEHHAADIAAATSVGWIGYLSTVGVYGDRGGAWVDEDSSTNPTSERSRRRVAAEEAWRAFGNREHKRVQIFRLAGIYGPGRSAIDRLRAGTAQRIVKPGQVFNRVHVDDIARVLHAAMTRTGSFAVYNVADDEPAPPQDVIAYAARLLQLPFPPEIAIEEAELSPMAMSFYVENKRISNARLRADLGVELEFPSFREGLRAILEGER
jgi:nucleoside-diphosphate-sugar epimerase